MLFYYVSYIVQYSNQYKPCVWGLSLFISIPVEIQTQRISSIPPV